PVADRVHLELVVAFDVVEVARPVPAVVVGDGGAVETGRGPDAGEGDEVGVDLRAVEIIQVARVARAGGTGHRGIDRMLVGPGGESASGVDHPEDRVHPYEIPRVDRLAAVERIAHQALRIDGVHAAVVPAVGRRAIVDAIELRLVEVVALFVFRASAARLTGDAAAMEHTIAGVLGRRGE